jgi:hypothetical protein
MNVRGCLSALLLAAAVISVMPRMSSAERYVQDRDHLTPQEADLVREAQVLDKRIEVFIKAIDRRMLVLSASAATPDKQLKKDSEKWGDLPTGSRAQLIRDIAKILDEAITNIDDVSSRDEKNPLIPKALRKLAAAASRIVDQLKPMQAQAKDEAEVIGFELLVKNAEEIVEAAGNLPAPAEKPKGKDKTEKTKETN